MITIDQFYRDLGRGILTGLNKKELQQLGGDIKNFLMRKGFFARVVTDGKEVD